MRTPKWEDLDDMVDFINSLVEEKADIIRTEEVTREAETDWLAGVLIRLERGEELYIMAEVGGRVVANSEISRGGGYQKHVGGIGIGIRRGYRDIGIGTEMMEALIDQGRQWCLQVLTLRVFASNERAIHVYERVGFTQTGRIPKKLFKGGKYIDEIVITKLPE